MRPALLLVLPLAACRASERTGAVQEVDTLDAIWRDLPTGDVLADTVMGTPQEPYPYLPPCPLPSIQPR